MQTVKIYRSHLKIGDNELVIVWDDGETTTVTSNNDRFDRIVNLVEMGQVYDLAREVDIAFEVRRAVEGSKFDVIGGVIVIDNEPLPEALSDLLLQFVDQGLDTLPLENFWANLSKNPTKSARRDLFAFLKANRVVLTRDGHFVVYKKVRDSWYDSHTGKTYLNKPGATISMPREKVDADRRNTCSRGLHVAAWDYAQGFRGTRLLLVKVNPRDVVAVPPDYNEQKMRVCKYLVLKEWTEYAPYDQSIYEEAMVNTTPELDDEEVYDKEDFDDDFMAW